MVCGELRPRRVWMLLTLAPSASIAWANVCRVAWTLLVPRRFCLMSATLCVPSACPRLPLRASHSQRDAAKGARCRGPGHRPWRALPRARGARPPAGCGVAPCRPCSGARRGSSVRRRARCRPSTAPPAQRRAARSRAPLPAGHGPTLQGGGAVNGGQSLGNGGGRQRCGLRVA